MKNVNGFEIADDHDHGQDASVVWQGRDAVGRLCHVCSHVFPISAENQNLSATWSVEGTDGQTITVAVVPQTVPTTGSPFHPSATHVDALGMPVAGVGSFPFHPTPCCGASASISDGPMYCKGCYEEVDYAYGNVPVQPFRTVTEATV